ncbi:unnamed protein product [Spirodela intermedia]|uniref:Dof-type domain-containing protein n=1 Tax=Spirodela intermedia TaxID=51605 RepID=A0A7I8KVQ3_SPIIN|nr:unnamed protein product [Spirodela intermedia]
MTESCDDCPRSGARIERPAAGLEAATAKGSEGGEEGDRKIEPPGAEKPAMKKPEKILPCPRCSSMATKFCYYNNYNVNQPRHFCKNCQRYWTAGGSMRNVPVGAGRRKSKHSAAAAAATSQPTVLRFGSDDPLCDSIRHAPAAPSSPHSSGSSVAASNLTEDAGGSNLQEQVLRSSHGSSYHPPPTTWPSTWSASAAVPVYPTAAFWGWGAAPALGKHSREDGHGHPKEESSEQIHRESCRLWIPKTLRIHNPEEAAKSSIWAMAGGVFKPFEHPKMGIRSSASLFHANPAALSRSLNFQESS